MEATETRAAARDRAYYRFLGRAIRLLRVERGLERKDLAVRSGLSYPYLSEVESGKKRASSPALRAIAEALGVRPHQLLAAAEALAEREPPDDVVGYAAGPTLAAPLAPAAPAMPRPRGFFHLAESSPPAEAPPAWSAPAPTPSAPPLPPERLTRPGRGGLEAALDELRWRLGRMASDDVARILDLARRLTG